MLSFFFPFLFLSIDFYYYLYTEKVNMQGGKKNLLCFNKKDDKKDYF